MSDQASAIARRLETIEARDGAEDEFDSELLAVLEPGTLLQVAERCVHNVVIAGALYRRGMAVGAPEESLRGYLALASIFEGDVSAARELVAPFAGASHNDVLLSAWANLDEEPGEVVRRLVEGLRRCPQSLRLQRQLADYALRVSRLDLAKRAHIWLLEHEPSSVERDRIQLVIREYGWSEAPP